MHYTFNIPFYPSGILLFFCGQVLPPNGLSISPDFSSFSTLSPFPTYLSSQISYYLLSIERIWYGLLSYEYFWTIALLFLFIFFLLQPWCPMTIFHYSLLIAEVLIPQRKEARFYTILIECKLKCCFSSFELFLSSIIATITDGTTVRTHKPNQNGFP